MAYHPYHFVSEVLLQPVYIDLNHKILVINTAVSNSTEYSPSVP